MATLKVGSRSKVSWCALENEQRCYKVKVIFFFFYQWVKHAATLLKWSFKNNNDNAKQ